MKNYKYRYLYYILTGPSSITNGLPGLYFGQHSTNNLNDGYIGSGKLLNQYLKNHPNNYERHIVAFYNTKEELDKAEYEAIHGILGMTNCLNLKEGGEGGCYKRSEESKRKQSDSMKGHIVKQETREKISKANKNRIFSKEQRYSFGNGSRGHNWNEEQKNNLSKIMKGKPCGPKGKHKVWDNKEQNKFHYE